MRLTAGMSSPGGQDFGLPIRSGAHEFDARRRFIFNKYI
jgi:hypothetical protein